MEKKFTLVQYGTCLPLELAKSTVSWVVRVTELQTDILYLLCDEYFIRVDLSTETYSVSPYEG